MFGSLRAFETIIVSFPRRRESRRSSPTSLNSVWIPACAGMTPWSNATTLSDDADVFLNDCLLEAQHVLPGLRLGTGSAQQERRMQRRQGRDAQAVDLQILPVAAHAGDALRRLEQGLRRHI